ncbi:MAG: hypothetical protein AAF938_10595 [Myxococcota bacterium]
MSDRIPRTRAGHAAFIMLLLGSCSAAVDDFRTCDSVPIEIPETSVCSEAEVTTFFGCVESAQIRACECSSDDPSPMCVGCRDANIETAFASCDASFFEPESLCRTCLFNSQAACLNTFCIDELEAFICCSDDCRARGDAECGACDDSRNAFSVCAASESANAACGSVFVDCIEQ